MGVRTQHQQDAKAQLVVRSTYDATPDVISLTIPPSKSDLASCVAFGDESSSSAEGLLEAGDGCIHALSSA